MGIFSLLDGGGDDGMLVGNLLLPLGDRCGGDDMGRSFGFARLTEARKGSQLTGLQLRNFYVMDKQLSISFCIAFCGNAVAVVRQADNRYYVAF